MCLLDHLKELNIANNNISTLPGNWSKCMLEDATERVQVDKESGNGKFELIFLGNNFQTMMDM